MRNAKVFFLFKKVFVRPSRVDNRVNLVEADPAKRSQRPKQKHKRRDSGGVALVYPLLKRMY